MAHEIHLNEKIQETFLQDDFQSFPLTINCYLVHQYI